MIILQEVFTFDILLIFCKVRKKKKKQYDEEEDYASDEDETEEGILIDFIKLIKKIPLSKN